MTTQIDITKLRIPTGRRKTSWLFTSVVEKVDSALPTNNDISWRSEQDLNPQPTDFESGALTTPPRCLQYSFYP